MPAGYKKQQTEHLGSRKTKFEHDFKSKINCIPNSLADTLDVAPKNKKRAQSSMGITSSKAKTSTMASFDNMFAKNYEKT